jgi:hypothetical protein
LVTPETTTVSHARRLAPRRFSMTIRGSTFSSIATTKKTAEKKK